MQIAYRARDITEAHIVAGLLKANGVEAHVGGHYLQGAMGEIGAAGFTNVHVEDDDVYPALQLIAEYESSRSAAVPAPAVGSKLNAYARWFLVAMAVLAVLWLGR